MDAIDCRLCTLLQEEFPLSSRPYSTMAEQLGISEQNVIERVGSLKKRGILRRIGASVSPRALEYTTTLAAVKVQPAFLSSVAKLINTFHEVTHNYERDDEFNVWFTIIAPNRERIEAICSLVRKREGVDALLELPSTQVFKLRVSFEMTRDKKHD